MNKKKGAYEFKNHQDYIKTNYYKIYKEPLKKIYQKGFLQIIYQ